jgi:hypothetical protein
MCSAMAFQRMIQIGLGQRLFLNQQSKYGTQFVRLFAALLRFFYVPLNWLERTGVRIRYIPKSLNSASAE